jgi:capsid protein
MHFQAPAPTAFEKFLVRVAPAMARERYRARVAFAYDAARISRLRDTPQHNPNPENTTDAYGRIRIMEQTRDLCENSVLFQSILTKLGNYALGEIRYQAKTADREWNKRAEAVVADWFKNADHSGRFSFEELCRIALYSYIRDGDFFWQLREDAGGLRLQGIESDRVGGNLPKISDTEASGVVFDKDSGRVTGYRIFRRGVNGTVYTDEILVPAENIVPFYDHLRYDQYRGVSKFAPVVTTGRDLKELMEATRIGVKFENYHGAISYTERGQANDPGSFFQDGPATDINGNAMKEFKMEPGMVKHLPNTARVDFLKSDRPSGQWQSYVQLLIKEIALSLDLPEGFVWNLAGLSGPGARMDAAQAYRKIRYIQHSIMAPRMDRVIQLVLLGAIGRGEIEYREDWKARAWQFPAMPTIDIGRDSAAGINEVRAGLLSKADWYAESGKDVDEEESTIAREATSLIERAKEISQATGFPVERVLDMLDMRIINGTPAITMPSAGGAQTQPLIATIGTAGTQAIAEIVGKVGTGELTPESARALLVQVFGLTAAAAREIVPDAAGELPAATEPADVEPIGAEFAADSYRPTEAMARNAKRALETRAGKPVSQRGMTAIGLARARDISGRRMLSLDTVRRMKAYFDRHEVDKQGETWDEQGKGWQAWNGWGGDEGRTWAEAVVKRADADAMAVPDASPAMARALSSMGAIGLFSRVEPIDITALAALRNQPPKPSEVKITMRQESVENLINLSRNS